MTTNEFENVDSTNNADETVNNEEEIVIDLDEEETEEVEDVETLKKKVQTLQAQKDHWRKKATEKVDTKPEVKETKSEVKTQNNLSTQDMFALMRNDVAEEDVDEIVEFASFKKISIAEALKSPTVKSILSEKKEMRKVAEATNANTTRRPTSRLSAEDIVANANKGNLPEDPIALAQARFALKKKK